MTSPHKIAIVVLAALTCWPGSASAGSKEVE
jgi:hypothetical protein